MVRLLVLVCVAVSFYDLGVASFAHAAPRLWSRIDARELKRLEPIVEVPALLGTLASLGVLWVRPGPPPFVLALAAALQLAVWSTTASWWRTFTRRLRARGSRLALCAAHAAVLFWTLS